MIGVVAELFTYGILALVLLPAGVNSLE